MLLGVHTSVQSQNYTNSIRGQVYDIDSGLHLPAVNVYLSNTTIGDATDTTGVYQIDNIPPGSYKLIYHFMGYERVIKEIGIGSKDTLTLNIGLKYVPFELDSVVVLGKRDRQWKRNLNRFIRHFIGHSNNAKNTKILNTEVLDFEIENFGVYSAKAQDELHIINDALGYESFVSLLYFKWNYFNDDGQAYYTVRMQELEPESSQQKKEWEIKRTVTYDQSIRKFFKSIVDKVKTINEEENSSFPDVEIFKFGTVEVEDRWYKLFNGVIEKLQFESKYRKYIPENDQYEVFGFRFEKFILEDPLTIIADYGERSYLDYHDPGAREYIFAVDQNGHLLNPLDVAVGGYWAKLRFADFLPLNYRSGAN
jgi:hypothetical protein